MGLVTDGIVFIWKPIFNSEFKVLRRVILGIHEFKGSGLNLLLALIAVVAFFSSHSLNLNLNLTLTICSLL